MHKEHWPISSAQLQLVPLITSLRLLPFETTWNLGIRLPDLKHPYFKEKTQNGLGGLTRQKRRLTFHRQRRRNRATRSPRPKSDNHNQPTQAAGTNTPQRGCANLEMRGEVLLGRPTASFCSTGC